MLLRKARKKEYLMRLSCFVFLFYSAFVFAGELLHKVIPVTYANPQSLVSALNPVLQSGESIAVFNNNLIANVSPETLTNIRAMLHQLDVPAPVFLISIHQDSDAWAPDEDQQASIYSTDGKDSQTNIQSVQVENGAYALISVGQNVPVLSQVSAGWVTGVGYDRMKTDNGFLIKPELQGDKVRIQIKRFKAGQDNMNAQNINTQGMQTSTVIAMNQWVKLSSVGGSDENASADATTYQAGGSSSSPTTLYIKVTRIGH